jgi:hypothetical protein
MTTTKYVTGRQFRRGQRLQESIHKLANQLLALSTVIPGLLTLIDHSHPVSVPCNTIIIMVSDARELVVNKGHAKTKPNTGCDRLSRQCKLFFYVACS